MNFRHSKFELYITFAIVCIFFPLSRSAGSPSINNLWEEQESMQKVGHSNHSGQIGFIGRAWCDTKLCSRDACAEEESIRTQELKPERTTSFAIHFSEQKMREEAFEQIFYSTSYLMQKQKMIVVTTSYGFPPRYSLSWIDLQPWPVFVSTKEAGFAFQVNPGATLVRKFLHMCVLY